MTKDEIIKSLLYQAMDKDMYAEDEDPDDKDYFAHDAAALHEAMELLNAAPEWVSVKDKMPEENEDVLVFVRAGKASWCAIMSLINGTWYEEFGNPCGYTATHWMPLPEPPKED